jgi:nucleoside 2-deoxyribosyltransferase
MQIYFAGPLFTPYERGFIDECAAKIRATGIEVFVPHEQSAFREGPITAKKVFDKDFAGLGPANAVLAILDGPMVDDGTACEIGMFWGLKQNDPTKKGVLGLLTDSRNLRVRDQMEGKGVNLYVLGVIEDIGQVVYSVDEAIPILKRWAEELNG